MNHKISRAADNKKALFLTVIFLMAVTLVFLITGIRSAGKERTAQNQRLEQERLESNYITELRNYLDGQGYYYSGVNLTKVWEGENEIEYHVSIHNDRIERAGEETKESIRKSVKQLGEKLGCKKIAVEFI